MEKEKNIGQRGETKTVVQGENINKKDSWEENKSNNEIAKINNEEKMPIGIKIAIGLASAVILFLIIFIAYQYGHNKSTTDKQSIEIQTMDNDKASDKVDLIGNGLGDNSNDNTNSIDNHSASANANTNTNVNAENTTLSKDAVDNLENDLNGVSNDDDEFQDVKIILDENIN